MSQIVDLVLGIAAAPQLLGSSFLVSRRDLRVNPKATSSLPWFPLERTAA